MAAGAGATGGVLLGAHRGEDEEHDRRYRQSEHTQMIGRKGVSRGDAGDAEKTPAVSASPRETVPVSTLIARETSKDEEVPHDPARRALDCHSWTCPQHVR